MKRNNCRRILVGLVMGGLVSMPAMAQQADTIKAAGMTLRECMEYAVSNSTKMKVAEADRNDEQVRRREAIMQAFTPYMNAGAGLYEDLGQKSYADVVQLRSELAQKEYQLTNTRNMGRDALLTLKDVMFWPADEELILDGPLTEPLSFEADAQQVAEFAKQNQPSAGIARLTLESAQLELKTARWGYSPRIRLDGGISTNYFTYPSDPNYQADATRIDIMAEIDRQEQTLIHVSNNGAPISLASQEQIFIPFYTTKSDGSGIGLSLSRQIMRAHNGQIDLSRSDETATEFTLIFR